jgi:hypothetical protein
LKARNAGIIRILKNVEIEEKISENINILTLYKHWLQNWNKNCLNIFNIFLERNDYYGFINLSNNNIYTIFRSDFSDDKDWEKEKKKLTKGLPKNRYTQNCLCKLKKSWKLLLKCAHSESSENKSPESILDIRSHGDFVKYFFEAESIKKVPEKKISENKIGEFIETVITQVCIFDNRLNQRIISKEKWILFDNVLGITFYEENIDIWNDLKKGKKHKWVKKTGKEKDAQLKVTPSIDEEFGSVIDNYHFLVIHLSFIEKLGFPEENIDEFIKKHIIQNSSKIPNKFIITIVTGRGREDWWKKLNSKYKNFVTFLPIESLLAAIEDGIMLKDDFQVKYNLIKVLFGS